MLFRSAAAQTTEAALPDVIAQINADPELSAQWGAWKPGAFRNQPIEILRAATNKAIKAIEEYRRRQLGDAADMKVPTIDDESIDLALMGGQRQIVATPEARNKAIDRVLARYDLTDASNVPAQRAFDIATQINKNQRARRATMSNVDAATLEGSDLDFRAESDLKRYLVDKTTDWMRGNGIADAKESRLHESRLFDLLHGLDNAIFQGGTRPESVVSPLLAKGVQAAGKLGRMATAVGKEVLTPADMNKRLYDAVQQARQSAPNPRLSTMGPVWSPLAERAATEPSMATARPQNPIRGLLDQPFIEGEIVGEGPQNPVRGLLAQRGEQVPVVGSYDTIKLADPSLPDSVYDGKYPVQFPDGDILKFATAKQATQAQDRKSTRLNSSHT